MEPNPTRVQDAGVNDPPRVLVKDTFPAGVAPEWDESATIAVQSAFDPACRGEGVQFTFTTIPRRAVELVDEVVDVVVVEVTVDVVLDELCEVVDVELTVVE